MVDGSNPLGPRFPTPGKEIALTREVTTEKPRAHDSYQPISLRNLLQAMKQALSRHDPGAKITDLAKAEAAKTEKGERTGRGEKREGGAGFVIREGRLTEIRPEVVGSEVLQESVRGREKEKATAEKEPGLFEKIFVGRFRDGKTLGEPTPQGRGVFAEKGEKEWVAFFQKMLPFAFEKKVSPDQFKEFVFRGIVQNRMVSDFRLADGKTDKFAQMEIPTETALAQLKGLTPGETVLPEAVLQKGQPEVVYTALSHKPVTKEGIEAASRAASQATEKMTKTLFDLTPQAQSLAARGLNLSDKFDTGLAQAQTVEPAIAELPKGGWLSILLGRKRRRGITDDDPWVNHPSVFVPWYFAPFQRRLQKVPGRPKWYWVFVSATVATILIVAVMFAVKFFLKN